MTPSIILLYVCSAVFVALFTVFSVFLYKLINAAKNKQVSAGISKSLHPAEDRFTKPEQTQMRIAKAK